jgi:uncharacterized protein YdaU (DUF1376 family)
MTMQEITPKAGKNKTGKRPYMRLFTSDYRDGTVNLDFELQGFYVRILTYLHDGETVPADASELARFLQCNARTVRKLLPKLIALGKLYQSGFELKNPRIERELEANSTPIQPEFEPNSAPKIQKPESNQEGSEPYYRADHFHSQFHNQKEEQVAAAEQEPAAPPLMVNLDDLEAKLFAACNGSLANPVNAQGLLNLGIPLMWLEQGCDLDRDVIPTLRAAGKKHHGRNIQSWGYFTPMISEAKAKREAGLPATDPSTTNPKQSARVAGATRAREALDRMMEAAS